MTYPSVIMIVKKKKSRKCEWKITKEKEEKIKPSNICIIQITEIRSEENRKTQAIYSQQDT